MKKAKKAKKESPAVKRDPVFCKDCRWFKDGRLKEFFTSLVEHECHSPGNTETITHEATWKWPGWKETRKKSVPQVRNAKNDCPEYTPKKNRLPISPLEGRLSEVKEETR